MRPASLGNKDNAKACESDAPSQWVGHQTRLRRGGLVEVSACCADTSAVGIFRDRKQPPISMELAEGAKYSLAGALSGEPNSLTLPARCLRYTDTRSREPMTA